MRGRSLTLGLGQLRHLLHGHRFRQLFAVRLTSQASDGMFQVGLAAYVVFSPEHAASPRAIAAVLAVVLLPFSALGPFVGVFLDRWSRRQVLVWANLVRLGLVLVLALLVAADVRGPRLFLLALVCLSVNRFLLAGLSAALPHVVAREELITANALTPTAGTLAFTVGAGLGTAARAGWHSWGPAGDGDVAVLVVAAIGYAVSAGLARRIPRALLGPDLATGLPSLRRSLGHVVAGLGAGLRHLGERRPAAYGLAAIGVQRFFYGLTTVSLILLYRNYFHGPGEEDTAFAELAVALLATGIGFVSAAVVTPVATLRLGRRGWLLALLLACAVAQLFPGGLYTEPALVVASFVLGFAAQGIKIVVDTLVQSSVDDAYRGRIFALYDVVFNVAFVAAAAAGAVVLPADGHSYPVLVVVALGYLATAVGYAWVSRPAAHTQPDMQADMEADMQADTGA